MKEGLIEFAKLNRDGKLTNVRYLSQGTIAKCPSFIFNPNHYKADGTCLCFDKEHQDKLRAERKARRERILAAQNKLKGGIKS